MDLLAAIFDNPLGSQLDTIPKVVEALLQMVAIVIIPVVIIFIIYAGFLFVSARGSEQQITKAKSVLTWSVIGAIFVRGAWAFATAIVSFFQTLT